MTPNFIKTLEKWPLEKHKDERKGLNYKALSFTSVKFRKKQTNPF